MNSNVKNNYKKGCVAYIDILGFKNLVCDTQNIDKIKGLFDFVKNFQDIFNNSEKIKSQVAFFSDSIVITSDSDDLGALLYPIWIAEDFLYKNTGLMFRGAIAEGLYYHEGAIAFGPAIVEAYLLEKEAQYSRITISDEIIKKIPELSLKIFKDEDDIYCCNLSTLGLLRHTGDGIDPSVEEIIKSLEDERNRICESIDNNMETDYIDKYTWRIKPYNYLCDNIEKYLIDQNIKYSESNVTEMNNMIISLEEV